MNPEENNDPVWKLLERARKREAGPAFVRNVVREVRVLDAESRDAAGAPGFWSFFFGTPRRLGWAAGSLAAVALVCIAFLDHPRQNSGGAISATGSPAAIPVVSASAAEDFRYGNLALDLIPAPVADIVPTIESLDEELQNLDYLDELLAVQDTVLLSDEEIARMLF